MFVERFLDWMETATARQRAEAADQLVAAYFDTGLDDEGLETAETALTLMSEDRASEVRMALAVALSDNPDAPRHIISALANDNSEIATYVLSRSPAFVNAELVDLAATGSHEQQIAIACRNPVTPSIAAAICEVSCTEACLGLLMNRSAILAPGSLCRLAERFGDDADVREEMMKRNDLPPEVRLLLIEKLGQSLDQLAVGKNWISRTKAKEAVSEECDKAAIKFLANENDAAITRVTQNLIERGRITPGFLLRSICMGNITLFARALSLLSDMQPSRVETILSGKNAAAFKAIYLKAGLPERAFDVFNCAISAWRAHLSTTLAHNPGRLPLLVTREVLKAYSAASNSTVDDLLVLLRKLSAEAARENARAKVSEVHEKKRQAAMLALEDKRVEEELINEFAMEFENELQSELEGEFAEIKLDVEDAVIVDSDAENVHAMKAPPVSVNGPSIIDSVTKQPLEVEIAA